MPEHVRDDGKEKRAYRTKRAAKHAGQKHMKAYKCSQCAQWHLGSKRKHRQKLRSKRNAP